MERREGLRERRWIVGAGFEQRHRAPELTRVNRAQNALGAPGSGPAKHRLGARHEPWTEHRVAAVCLCLVATADRVELRGRTAAKARDLREYEPHPVAALLAGAQLGERGGVDVRLRLDEPLERVEFAQVAAGSGAAAWSAA